MWLCLYIFWKQVSTIDNELLSWPEMTLIVKRHWKLRKYFFSKKSFFTFQADNSQQQRKFLETMFFLRNLRIKISLGTSVFYGKFFETRLFEQNYFFSVEVSFRGRDMYIKRNYITWASWIWHQKSFLFYLDPGIGSRNLG